MQTLERILTAPTTGHATEPSPQKNHDGPALADFSKMMQQALAPSPKETVRETTFRHAKKNSAPVKTAGRLETNSSTVSETENTGPVAPTAAPSAAKTRSQASPVPAAKNASENSLPLTAAPAEVPQPQPLLINFVPLQTPPGNSAPAKTISTGTTIPPVAGALDAATAGPLISKIEKTVAEKASTLLTDVAPSKPAEIEDAKPVAVVKSKDFGVNGANAAEVPTAKNLVPAEIPTASLNAEPVQKSLEPAAEAISVVSTLPAAETDGTGVATLEMPMKNNAKTNKLAGLDVKVLPGDRSLPALKSVLLPTPSAGPVRAADDNFASATGNLPLPATVATVDFSTAQPALVLPALTDARMRNVERMHDMVVLHAVRLDQAQTDTLSVVIKPGAGTELSLLLRQRDGGIEAQATLQRGDFQMLNQHWPELQQRLEQRGIKLAPLGGEADFSTDSGGSFQQQPNASSRELEAQKASAFAEFALASRAVGATARLAVGVAAGGWESWA